MYDIVPVLLGLNWMYKFVALPEGSLKLPCRYCPVLAERKV